MKALPGPTSQLQDVKSKPDGPGPGKVGILIGGKIKYVDRPGYVAPDPPAVALSVPLKPVKKVKPKRAKKTQPKVDPAFLQKIRELRDRYLEHVNTSDDAQKSLAKYDVAKALPAPANDSPAPMKRRRFAA